VGARVDTAARSVRFCIRSDKGKLAAKRGRKASGTGPVFTIEVWHSGVTSDGCSTGARYARKLKNHALMKRVTQSLVKARVCTAVLMVCSLLSTVCWAAPGLTGREAPDFVLKGLDGRNVRLSEYRGQVVLVNFWARWERDSRLEIPALDRINITYNRAGLVVLGVSVDEDSRRAHEFAEEMKVTYPMLFDTSADIGRDYLLQKLPMTILVDREGVVRFSNVGYQRGDDHAYVDKIRELLRE
jgi:peroxiredoxin